MPFKGSCFLLALAAILFSGAIPLSDFGRWSPKKLFCEIILKPGHWPRRRYRLKNMLTDGRSVRAQVS